MRMRSLAFVNAVCLVLSSEAPVPKHPPTRSSVEYENHPFDAVDEHDRRRRLTTQSTIRLTAHYDESATLDQQ